MYHDYGSDNYNLTDDEINDLIENIKFGKVEKPEWMKNLEENNVKDKECVQNTTLYIIPKDEKYNDIAKKIIKFLYSVESGESYC